MKKRLFATVLILIMALTTLVGCGSKESDGDQTADKGSETEKSEDGDTSLRFLDVSPSPERQEYYERVFAEFTEETGIAVQYESVPWDDAANKITVLGSSGQLPDILTTTALWLGQLTEAEWIMPIDDYVAEHEDEFVETVKKTNWESERQNYGHVYTVPDAFLVKGIFYRKDWVEEIGYEIPTGDDWTYEAYFELIDALADEEKNRYGNSFRGGRGAFDPLLTYIETFFEGYAYDQEGNSVINTPEGVKAIENWSAPYLNGSVPKDSVNWGFVEMVDNFTGGLTGTLLNDSEVAVSCERNMDPEEWGVLPMPKSDVDGKIYNTVNSPYSYTVTTQSTNSEAALELLDFLLKPENNIEYSKMGGYIPVKRDVADDETYGVDGPYAAFVQQLNDPDLVIPPTFGPFNFSDMHQDTFHSELQKYLLGTQSAEDVAENIGSELTNRMKAYLEENEGAVVESPKTLQ